MIRRDFIKTLAANAVLLSGKTLAYEKRSPHVGVQIYCHNIFDEGIERILDTLQELGAINTLYLITHTYYAAQNRHPKLLADHGIPKKDERKRAFPKVWVKTNEKYYKNTILRHQSNAQDFEYSSRDLFSEIQKPLRERNMKLFARWYEPSDINRVMINGKPSIANWEKVLVVDMDGKPGKAPCWNNPDYREWLRASVVDMFNNYDLDGLQFGAERVGPLSEQLFRQGFVPTCFCDFCVAKNKERGINANMARQGYRELYNLMVRVRNNQAPVNGIITSVLGLLQKYPEILGWNYQWLQADNEIHDMIYKAVKSVNPKAEVARHVDHQRSSWDIFYRSAVPYAEMQKSCDWIKPIIYHEVFGPRLRHWKLEEEHKTLTKELSLEQSLKMFYNIFQYPADEFPSFKELGNGIPPEYVYIEKKRAVDGTNGKIPVAAGIGIDIPFNGERFPSDPESVYKATMLAFKAGARGVVASREYDEMQFKNIKAFGDAVRDFKIG